MNNRKNNRILLKTIENLSIIEAQLNLPDAYKKTVYMKTTKGNKEDR